MTTPAAVVTGPLVFATAAAPEMPAESCGSTHLDRGHDAPLGRRHRRAMLFTIGFAVAAEDVRHFQLRAIQGARRLEGLRRGKPGPPRKRTRRQNPVGPCRGPLSGRAVHVIFCGGPGSVAAL